MKQAKILLLDFNPASGLGTNLRGILESSSPRIQLRQESIEAYEPAICNSNLSSIALQFGPDLMLLVLSPSLLKQAPLFPFKKGELSALPIIVITEECRPNEILELLKLGATDFIIPPFKAINVLPRIWRLLDQTRREEPPIQTLKEKIGLKQIVGESPAFIKEIKKIPLVANCDANVLILGETGTGKELCARAIHYLSPRGTKPFIPVNCGAIPVELVENELFGHERGAFTGASRSQPGLIYEADTGTIFLDEIDCLSLLAQVKLLRFLQEREYRPLGSKRMRKADVRVIAATNVDLEAALREGTLRRDLYYRLNVIPFSMIPLRERREDIPLLARHFLVKYAARFNKQVMNFSLDAMQILMLYDWPGNVRELEHIVERAAILCEGESIQSTDIVLSDIKATACQESFQRAKLKIISQFERTYIEGLLFTYNGNITKAAQAAKKNRRAFWQLIRKHRINAQGFKSGVL